MKEDSAKHQSYAVLILAAAVLTALDQATKILAEKTLPGNPRVLIPGVFELRYLENRGAAFGILHGDALAHGCCAFELQEREAFGDLFELMFYLGDGHAAALNLLLVLLS